MKRLPSIQYSEIYTESNFHTFTFDEIYLGKSDAKPYGQHDASDSVYEARGKSIITDPWGSVDQYGNPVHIQFAEYHLAPNIKGYGFFDNQNTNLYEDFDVYNLGVLDVGTYEILTNVTPSTFYVIDSNDNILDASNFEVSDYKEHHLVISKYGYIGSNQYPYQYSVELNQISGNTQTQDPIINSPNITGLSSASIYENVPGEIIGRIYANDYEDGTNLTLSIENELDGANFEIFQENGNNYLKLASNFQADYEVSQSLDVKVRATDSDGNYDIETLTIQVLDDLYDNSGFNKSDQENIIDPLRNDSGWKGFGGGYFYSQMLRES